jgi:hypothetical protein
VAARAAGRPRQRRGPRRRPHPASSGLGQVLGPADDPRPHHRSAAMARCICRRGLLAPTAG